MALGVSSDSDHRSSLWMSMWGGPEISLASPLWLQVGWLVLRTVWMMSASSAPTAQSSLQASSCSRPCRVIGHLDTDLVISLDLVTTTLAMTLRTRVDLFGGLAYALFGEDV